MTGRPSRVLLISATIGEGHNATARAVTEAAQQNWPDCEIAWVDALDVMGPGVRRAFNRIYAFNVDTTPWLYDFFYWALWRYRWFANGCRRFVGAWAGRRLRSVLREHDPDLVVSTYPLGTAGLNWLRRREECTVPVAAVVSDFSPHPFWVYPEIDTHYVMSAASLRAMRHAEPNAIGAVCSPPVVSSFQPVDRAVARRSFGFDEEGFTVLISCGALGFGSISRAAYAALRAPDVRRVVVVCGRNEQLRAQLAAPHDPRLVPLGWVTDMATLTAAADVVVTNAGGATSLEALACARPVVMFEPIAGHGRANAQLMSAAGLAHLCADAPELTARLRRWTAVPEELAEFERHAREHRQSGDFTEETAALAELGRHRGKRALRAQDAFFVHANTPVVDQKTSAILLLEEDSGATSPSTSAWYALIADRIDRYAAQLPLLSRELVERRVLGPQWLDHREITAEQHLQCRDVTDDAAQDRVAAEFLNKPVRTDVPPWELLLLRRADGQRTLLLAKMHHALGDGVAVTTTLVRLLCTGLNDMRTADPTRPARSAVQTVARGLWHLARSGPAGPSRFTGRSSTARSFAWCDLPATQVRGLARSFGVSSSALLIGLLAEAVHRQRDSSDEVRERDAHLRAMVPKTTRNGRSASTPDTPGNHTVSLAVDLPVGAYTLPERLARTDALLNASDDGGQSAAAGAALSTLGHVPSPLQRRIVRAIYQRRFFHAVVSVLPGRRRPVFLGQTRVASVYPLLSLADGVGLAAGAINWGQRVGFGVTTDPALAPHAHALTTSARAAFDELVQPGTEHGGNAG